METKIFSCILVASKSIDNSVVIELCPVICNGYDFEQTESAMQEHAKKIFEKEIIEGYKVSVKIVGLNKDLLRDLVGNKPLPEAENNAIEFLM